jgi:hypothetical protein
VQLAATAPASRSDLAVCVQTDRLTAPLGMPGSHASDGGRGRSRVGRRATRGCVRDVARGTAEACACARWLWPAARDDAAAGAFCRGTRALRASQPGSPSATSWRSPVERRKTPLPPVFFFPRPQSFPPKKAVANPKLPQWLAPSGQLNEDAPTLHHRRGSPCVQMVRLIYLYYKS